jgi:hypothetical protein
LGYVYVAGNNGGTDCWINKYTLSGGDPGGSPVSWKVANATSVAGLAVDPISGNVYVVADSNNKVYEYSSAGVSITNWFSSGANGIAIYNSDVYVLSQSGGSNTYITETDLSGNSVATGIGSGIIPGGGLAIDASGNFFYPSTNGKAYMDSALSTNYGNWNICSTAPLGIAVDTADDIYIVDQANHQICLYFQHWK